MTRALLTINFNGALCDNSRRSMQAACERWGADFWEWNEETPIPRIPVAPNALKCWAFRASEFVEIFILDADTVVSSRCPSPFETFAGPELVAVKNGSERFGDLPEIRSCESYEWSKLQAQEPRLAEAQYVEGQYFNTGMMLARREHHAEMFMLASEVCLVDHGVGWIDQTQLNMAAIITGVKVLYADETWNWIHASHIGGDYLKMSKNVYHFAGEVGREHIIPFVKWQ